MKHKMMLFFILVGLVTAGFSNFLNGDVKRRKDVPKGIIKGKLVDIYTQKTIAGASVILAGTGNATVTGTDGEFSFTGIAAGSHGLEFDFEGFMPLLKSYIMVRPGRITYVNAEMEMVPVVNEHVTVSGGYFRKEREQMNGTAAFSTEEIRKAPGSAGDVSRIVFVLPSVSKLTDEHNSLIVRGGNPSENTFFVDNIEIPNINHFPDQGVSSGGINLLNVDLIDDVSFYSGGFSAMYGNKLSSVMDINFREGNRENFDMQVDLSIAGIGGVSEGPLGKKGSWIFSGRRSYLELLQGAMGLNQVPSYYDVQGKFMYELSPRNKLTFLGIAGWSRFNEDRADVLEDGDEEYHRFSNRSLVFGLNWLSLWGAQGYSETSLSYASTTYDTRRNKTVTGAVGFSNDSSDASLRFRNINRYSFSRFGRVSFGVEAKFLGNRQTYYMPERINRLGDIRPGIAVDVNRTAATLGIFAEYSADIASFFRLNLGVRGDYFSYTGDVNISPRLSVELKLSARTSLTGSAGLYYQDLPLLLLYQDSRYRNLEAPLAYHYSVGMTHMFSEDTRFSLEVYNKEYRHFPLDITQSMMFPLDVFVESVELFECGPLTDTGRAYSRGIEFILHKKLKSGFYGMISGAFTQTRYRDMEGIWRDRIYDNRFVFSVEAGYRPGRNWEFGLRWIYAGGRPYTPFDLEASRAVTDGIFDRGRINGERMPDYHSLNIRVDRRFHFSGSNLVIYVSVWNVYNRNNVHRYYWNVTANEPAIMSQIRMMPILGIEYEF